MAPIEPIIEDIKASLGAIEFRFPRHLEPEGTFVEMISEAKKAKCLAEDLKNWKIQNGRILNFPIFQLASSLSAVERGLRQLYSILGSSRSSLDSYHLIANDWRLLQKSIKFSLSWLQRRLEAIIWTRYHQPADDHWKRLELYGQFLQMLTPKLRNNLPPSENIRNLRGDLFTLSNDQTFPIEPSLIAISKWALEGTAVSQHLSNVATPKNIVTSKYSPKGECSGRVKSSIC